MRRDERVDDLARRSAGTTVSTRSSKTRSSRPDAADGRVGPSPPRKVPVPAVYQEQRS